MSTYVLEIPLADCRAEDEYKPCCLPAAKIAGARGTRCRREPATRETTSGSLVAAAFGTWQI